MKVNSISRQAVNRMVNAGELTNEDRLRIIERARKGDGGGHPLPSSKGTVSLTAMVKSCCTVWRLMDSGDGRETAALKKRFGL